MEGRIDVLTIGASDPGGDGGIQADLRVMTQLGTHPTAVITAVTVNSVGSLKRLGAVGAEAVSEQLQSLASRPLRAIKTGLLTGQEVVSAVAREVRSRRLPTIVDPVLATAGGGYQADAATIRAYRTELLPQTTAVVCDLPGAALLVGISVDRAAAIRALVALGAGWVVLRDCGPEGPGEDLVSDGQHWYVVRSQRVPGPVVQTGVLSAALASRVAAGYAVPAAAGWARERLPALLAGVPPMSMDPA